MAGVDAGVVSVDGELWQGRRRPTVVAGLGDGRRDHEADRPSVFPTWVHFTLHLLQGPQAFPSFLNVQASPLLRHPSQGTSYVSSVDMSVVGLADRAFDLA